MIRSRYTAPTANFTAYPAPIPRAKLIKVPMVMYSHRGKSPEKDHRLQISLAPDIDPKTAGTGNSRQLNSGDSKQYQQGSVKAGKPDRVSLSK